MGSPSGASYAGRSRFALIPHHPFYVKAVDRMKSAYARTSESDAKFQRARKSLFRIVAVGADGVGELSRRNRKAGFARNDSGRALFDIKNARARKPSNQFEA